MKKILLVASLTLLCSGGALAQTTLYGRVNTSVERQNIAGVKNSGVFNNSSRIGVLGSEDLGGGLQAGFQLEHGFNSDTGAATQGSAIWARQSEVNLSGQFGALRLGNFKSEAYFATADYVSMHNHDTGSSADALYAYVGRNANKVGYRSPSLNGLTLEGALSMKEAGTDHSYDLAANYKLGPLALGAGFEKLANAKQFAVRALYEMGPFFFGGYLQHDTDGYGAGLGNRTTLRLSGMYTVGMTEFHLNIGRAGNYSTVADSAASQGTVGVNHNLSKRTKVYGFFTKVAASAGTPYAGDFNSIALGVRHNF